MTVSKHEYDVLIELIQGKTTNSRYDLHNLVINWNETGIPLDPPTRQERRVMFLLINGISTNAEIAALLGIEPDTAANHCDNLRAKFAAKTRAQLTAYIFHSILISLFGDLPTLERIDHEECSRPATASADR